MVSVCFSLCLITGYHSSSLVLDYHYDNVLQQKRGSNFSVMVALMQTYVHCLGRLFFLSSGNHYYNFQNAMLSNRVNQIVRLFLQNCHVG